MIAAISDFREQAKDAGNLESDGKQEVAVNDAGAIEIKPAVPDEIYVPYYEPEEVVVRQPVLVYHYPSPSLPGVLLPLPSGLRLRLLAILGRHLRLQHRLALRATCICTTTASTTTPYYSYRYHSPFYYRAAAPGPEHL